METLTFHNPPKVVRDYFRNWRETLEKDPNTTPVQRAVMDDAIMMMDVALKYLAPAPTPENVKPNKPTKQ